MPAELNWSPLELDPYTLHWRTWCRACGTSASIPDNIFRDVSTSEAFATRVRALLDHACVDEAKDKR